MPHFLMYLCCEENKAPGQFCVLGDYCWGVSLEGARLGWSEDAWLQRRGANLAHRPRPTTDGNRCLKIKC